jgi:DNA-binding response OmpR family regulator
MVLLTPTETKILYILLQNAGQIVTNDFLLRRVWPNEEVFEDALRVHIARLRKKIEETPASPQHIVTERGIGYGFFLTQ